jgi:hemerythrin
MPLMTWTKELSVNIKQIDDQHKKLVELLNSFHDAMKLGKGKELMESTLSELLNYTIYHFSTEETLFKTHGYPEAIKHKKEHDALTAQALDLKERYSRGDLFLSNETMMFLKNWLNNHIIVTDRKYTAFLNGKGVY